MNHRPDYVLYRLRSERLWELVENKRQQQLKKKSAVGFLAMEDAANLDGVRSGADEKEPVVADAEPEFFSSLESLYVAFAGIAKRCKVVRMRIAVGLSRLRTSALAGSVQTMRFTWFFSSVRFLPG